MIFPILLFCDQSQNIRLKRVEVGAFRCVGDQAQQLEPQLYGLQYCDVKC